MEVEFENEDQRAAQGTKALAGGACAGSRDDAPDDHLDRDGEVCRVAAAGIQDRALFRADDRGGFRFLGVYGRLTHWPGGGCITVSGERGMKRAGSVLHA